MNGFVATANSTSKHKVSLENKTHKSDLHTAPPTGDAQAQALRGAGGRRGWPASLLAVLRSRTVGGGSVGPQQQQRAEHNDISSEQHIHIYIYVITLFGGDSVRSFVDLGLSMRFSEPELSVK